MKLLSSIRLRSSKKTTHDTATRERHPEAWRIAKSIDVGQIANAVMTLLTFLLVWFTWRTADLAEQEVRTKVHDLQQVVDQLEAERLARLGLETSTLEMDARLTRESSKYLGITMELTRGGDKTTRGLLTKQSMCIAALGALYDGRLRDQDRQRLLRAVFQLNGGLSTVLYLSEISAKELEHIGDRADSAQQAILSSIPGDRGSASFKEYLEGMKTEIAASNARLSRDLERPRKQMAEAEDVIIEVLKAGRLATATPVPPPASP